MKKCYIMTAREFADFLKATALMLVKGIFRVPCAVFLGLASLSCWFAKKVAGFCKEHTKAAVIIGFVMCLVVMFVEFVYFKIQLQKSSYKTSELIKKNYELEQTDRYDIGYHDAMKKNKEMLTQNMKQ